MGIKVRERKPGEWYVVVHFQGRRKYRFFPSKDRAQEFAGKVKSALDVYGADAFKMLETPQAPKPAAALPRVKDYAGKWIREIERSGLKLKTRQSYDYLIERHIVPSFGEKRLDEISYSLVKNWILEKSEKYARDTVRLMLATFRSMLSEAVSEEFLAVNPIMKLGRFYRSAPKRKERIDPFTLSELHAVESKCREVRPDHYVFILVMSRTGMRIGEAVALQWDDIDWAAHQILIRRNMPAHRQVELPKTVASERRVDMSPELAAVLVSHRRIEKERWFKEGSNLPEWIFATDNGTPLHYHNFLRRVWKVIQEKARVRPRTPHDLRHTWASHMLAAGEDLAYVSSQLGHKNPGITLSIYTHWIPGKRRISADVFDGKNATKTRLEENSGPKGED